MKKNGFIATSLLYAFFLVFISLFIVLLLNYLRNRVLVQKIDDNARDKLSEINNLKISDMQVGDYVQFRNSKTITASANPLSEKGIWQVARVDTNGTNKTYYILSDLNAASPSIKIPLYKDYGVSRRHPMTVAVFNEMNKNGKFVSAIQLSQVSYSALSFQIVPASFLQDIRNNNSMDKYIKRSLFKMDDNYVVAVNASPYNYAAYKYTTNYNYPEIEYAGNYNTAYYLYRNYTFDNYRKTGDSSLLGKKALLESYCGASYANDVVTYTYSSGGQVLTNPFGYMDITEDTTKDENGEIQHTKYLDFCYFASPVGYTHNTNDLIVIENETSPSTGDLLTTESVSSNRIRMLMTITVNTGNANTYIAGGKGISTDPFIVTNGVKQS